MGVLGFDTQWGTTPNPARSPDPVWLIFASPWPHLCHSKQKRGRTRELLWRTQPKPTSFCIGVTEEGFKHGHISSRLQEGLPTDLQWGGEMKGEFYQVSGCIWSHRAPDTAFIFLAQWVVVTHQSLSGVETALRVRATNKQGRERERQKTFALTPPTLSLSLGYMRSVLGLAISAQEVVGVWQICHEAGGARGKNMEERWTSCFYEWLWFR